MIILKRKIPGLQAPDDWRNTQAERRAIHGGTAKERETGGYHPGIQAGDFKDGPDYENVPLRALDINRPGLPLTGFFEHFDTKRLLLIGLTEHTYLSGLTPEPSVSMAEFLLKTAVKTNPGPWEQHSRYAAESAGRIAERCPGLDPERAYIYGLLHDIGRKFGISGLAHVYDGYHYLMELGYANAARIALTHSFNLKDIRDYIGKFDINESEQEEIRAFLAEIEYNDYDF